MSETMAAVRVSETVRWVAVGLVAVSALICLLIGFGTLDGDPAHETWGIVLRVVQFPALLLLGYLAVRPPAAEATA